MKSEMEHLLDLADGSPLTRAKELVGLPNTFGMDSTKRAAALELLAGKPDGRQTERLLKLAIAMAEARGDG